MFDKIVQIIALVDHEPLKKADAIILLTGDGFFRIKKAIELYKQRWASIIVISGGVSDLSYGSYPAIEFGQKLIEAGVPKSKIILDNTSQNTREQAMNMMKLVRKKNWQRIILVASNYHQYRAYMTFLKAMLEASLKIEIINAPAILFWFKKEPWGRRIDLLEKEFEKIYYYTKNGHIATYDEVINYQLWKEK